MTEESLSEHIGLIEKAMKEAPFHQRWDRSTEIGKHYYILTLKHFALRRKLINLEVQS